MLSLLKTLFVTLTISFVALQLEWNSVNGFNFDGSTVPCDGVNVTGYPKMKEQYLKCNKSVFEDYKKRGESTKGYGPMLCTAMCVFIEDELVDKTSGKLIKKSLDNYKGMFEHMPEKVRQNITDVFYNCFEEKKDDSIYNSTNPHDCNGIMGVGLCIKLGFDGVCNPEEPEPAGADDDE